MPMFILVFPFVALAIGVALVIVMFVRVTVPKVRLRRALLDESKRREAECACNSEADQA